MCMLPPNHPTYKPKQPLHDDFSICSACRQCCNNVKQRQQSNTGNVETEVLQCSSYIGNAILACTSESLQDPTDVDHSCMFQKNRGCLFVLFLVYVCCCSSKFINGATGGLNSFPLELSQLYKSVI